ncbi:MAG: PQQ-dependent sugar dehydrogenase [Planctomycetota bacterium]
MRRVMWRRAVWTCLLIGLVYLAGWGCLLSPSGDPAPLTVGAGLQAEYVVAGAQHPSALAFAADGRVFYTEKNTGRIRVIVGGTLVADPVAAVPVNYAGDRGLLGIALHPDFAQNGRIYVFYTRSDTGQTTNDAQAVIDNRVVYIETVNNAVVGSEVFVASLPADQGTTRVSGRLAFATDRKLLVAIGDLTVDTSARDNNVLVGKILRYNDDGSIPDDNPTAGSAVYARGLRDVRGLCVDPDTGTPLALERNTAGADELNRIQAGGNYGWPDVTGGADTTAELAYADDNPDYRDPLLDSGSSSRGFVGGSFNPSTRYGPHTLAYFFYGEAASRRVISARMSAARNEVETSSPFAAGFPGTITDVAFTPAGTLYVACDNAIFRLAPTP